MFRHTISEKCRGGVVVCYHALLVERLQDWEFREVTKLTVLERCIGEQNGILSGLEAYAVLFRGDD